MQLQPFLFNNTMFCQNCSENHLLLKKIQNLKLCAIQSSLCFPYMHLITICTFLLLCSVFETRELFILSEVNFSKNKIEKIQLYC